MIKQYNVSTKNTWARSIMSCHPNPETHFGDICYLMPSIQWRIH